MGQSFFPFLRPSEPPLYVYTHILFIHSYVNEHLGWFQLLATMNKAAMHMVYKYIVKTLLSILQGIYWEMGLLDHT